MPDIEKSEKNNIETISTARKLTGCIILLIVLFLLDQITKQAAVAHLAGQPPRILIQGVLEFKYTENTGAAFAAPGLARSDAVIYFRFPFRYRAQKQGRSRCRAGGGFFRSW